MTSRTLVLILDMSDGSTRKVTVQKPDDEVGLQEINSFLTPAISTGLFTVNGVTVQGLVRAYLDTHTIVEIDS